MKLCKFSFVGQNAFCCAIIIVVSIGHWCRFYITIRTNTVVYLFQALAVSRQHDADCIFDRIGTIVYQTFAILLNANSKLIAWLPDMNQNSQIDSLFCNLHFTNPRHSINF